MSENPDLLAARNPDGSQRFYPPGEHPATAQLRETRRRAQSFADRLATPYLNDAERVVNYCDVKLAQFEWGEEQAKRRWIECNVPRPKPIPDELPGLVQRRLDAEKVIRECEHHAQGLMLNLLPEWQTSDAHQEWQDCS